MKLSEELNTIPEESARGFLAIQKYSAPNKPKFTISGIQDKKLPRCKEEYNP